MAIQIADQFTYSGLKPLDARLQYSTVANMKAAAEASLYNGCLAYVIATKKYYSYDSSNSVDSTTGKWREFESGGGGGSSTLSGLTDTNITNPSNNQILMYDSSSSKWINGTGGGGEQIIYKTTTLAASSTTVTFTEMPTSGNYYVDFFTSTGINYTAINLSTPGQVTLTFKPQQSAVTVACKIWEVN